MREGEKKRIVSVAVDAPIWKTLSYEVPMNLDFVRVGWRVAVPLGARSVTGFIVAEGACEEEIEKLRKIFDAPDSFALFDETALKLCKFLANYYIAPLGQMLAGAVPTAMDLKNFCTFRLLEPPDDLEWLTDFQKRVIVILRKAEISEERLEEKLANKNARKLLRDMEKLRYIERVFSFERREISHSVEFLKLSEVVEPDSLEKLANRAPAQAAFLRYLIQNGDVSAKIARKLFGAGAVRACVEKLFATLYKKELFATPRAWHSAARNFSTLTDSQHIAIQTISEALDLRTPCTFLLHGVTGSGKTLVYVEAAKHARTLGFDVLVLVPEVALTPQMESILRETFGEEVAVLHSYLSPMDRAVAWQRLLSGEVHIALGARSAIFAPLRNLGLIIVDEEHDGSYKQGKQPFYNARDAAVVRGGFDKAVVVLGSATPSIESYYNAQTGKYRLLEMPERVPGSQLPKVQVVDIKKLRANEQIFSPHAVNAILETVSANKNAILLLNRRGFSSNIICTSCGHIPQCPNCDVSLTYHVVGDELRCHWCDFRMPAIDICPVCETEGFKHRGKGTQKIETALLELLPAEKIFRIDSDAVSRRGALEKILESFISTDGAVIVGTQMIAKGHDIHNVTLVVVIDADTSRDIPDFRAGEKTFQLLSQVAGRAGRGENPGTVIIQTRHPDDMEVLCAINHDYKSFYNNEIMRRRTMLYPPFSRLVRVVAQHMEECAAKDVIQYIYNTLLSSDIDGTTILFPTIPPISRLKGYYRWHLLMRTTNIRKLLRNLHDIAYTDFKDARVRIDVDAIDMM